MLIALFALTWLQRQTDAVAVLFLPPRGTAAYLTGRNLKTFKYRSTFHEFRNILGFCGFFEFSTYPEFGGWSDFDNEEFSLLQDAGNDVNKTLIFGISQEFFVYFYSRWIPGNFHVPSDNVSTNLWTSQRIMRLYLHCNCILFFLEIHLVWRQFVHLVVNCFNEQNTYGSPCTLWNVLHKRTNTYAHLSPSWLQVDFKATLHKPNEWSWLEVKQCKKPKSKQF